MGQGHSITPIGPLIDVITDNKVWYNCPCCGERVWAYPDFVGTPCWNCGPIKTIGVGTIKAAEFAGRTSQTMNIFWLELKKKKKDLINETTKILSLFIWFKVVILLFIIYNYISMTFYHFYWFLLRSISNSQYD